MSAGPGPAIEPVRELYERFERDDIDAVIDLLHPECEFHQNSEFPGDRVHLGRDGLRTGWATFRAEWEDFRFEPLALEAGERVWVRVRVSGRGRASRIPVELEVSHVWDLRDGVPWRCRVFLEERQARAEAGLPG